MIAVRLICVGKMREKHYIDAFKEYEKRLSGYCRFECVELPETKLPDGPSEKQIAAALDKEAELVLKNCLPGAFLVALCVEGKQFPSEGMARLLRDRETDRPKICFLVGGSYGLAEQVKAACDLRLSMSEMTFPHHLARVMLAEQIYRGFKINEGSAYHK